MLRRPLSSPPATLAIGHHRHSPVGLFWVADARVGQDHRVRALIDGVPDSASPRDLVLPLLHHDATDRLRRKHKAQLVLALGAMPRHFHDLVVRLPRRPRRLLPELTPPFLRPQVQVTEVPSPGSRRRMGASSMLLLIHQGRTTALLEAAGASSRRRAKSSGSA